MGGLGFAIRTAGRRVTFTPPRELSSKVVSMIKVSRAHLYGPLSRIHRLEPADGVLRRRDLSR